MLSLLLFTIAVAMVLWLFYSRWRQMQLLKELGIPGPTPNLMFGSFGEISSKGYLQFIDHYSKRYRSVWGYYEALQPVIVISDPDMIKEITIKQFSNFHSRKVFSTLPSELPKNIFTEDRLHAWRRLRAISSPSFTAVRMKEMSPIVNHSVDNMLVLFEQKCKEGKAFNIHKQFQRLTLDVLGSCVLGLDINTVKDENSIFMQKTRYFFDNLEKAPPLAKVIMILFVLVPSLTKTALGKLFSYLLPGTAVMRWINQFSEKMIEYRKSQKTDRVDFMNLMLNANKIASTEEEIHQMEPQYTDGIMDDDHLKLEKGMTMEEMKGAVFLFLLAGYDSTSVALAFSSHELAINPDIQEKLQTEIDEHFPEQECRPDYMTVHKMAYLDMFVNEVLRLHTIGAVGANRKAHKTCQIGGYTIPAGAGIQLDLEAAHMNPDLWGPEDPTKCVPERFLPERKQTRHPEAWVPFGAGPRTCIGMRFALMELKIALVRVLKKYSIQRCAETQVPIQKNKGAVKGPANGVYVKLSHR